MSTWDDYLASKSGAAPAVAPSSPAAPVAAAPTPNSWERYISAQSGRKAPNSWETYLATKAKPVTQPVRNVAFDLGQAARNTAGAVGDVFGTLQRGTVGAIYGAEHGGVIPAINEGVYGAFHPHDTGIVDRNDLNFRQTTHLEDLKDHSAAPNLLGRGRNFGVDFAGQTISDPGMLVGGPIIKGALKGLEMGAKAIPGVEAGARAIAAHPQFRETQNFIRALGPEKTNLTPKGVAASTQADTRLENKYRALQQAVEAVHARNAEGMNAHWQDPENVAYPEEAARAMHGIGYLGGDADARAKATAAGFDPLTGEHLDTPLLNLHTWREGYVPKQRITVKDLEDENPLDPNMGPAAGKVAVRRPRGIGYAKQQAKGDESTPLADRWLARATKGLLDAKKAEKQQRFIDDFGLDHGRHTGRAVELGDEIMRATDPAHKAKLVAEREAELRTAAAKQARVKDLIKPTAVMEALRLGQGGINTTLTSKGEAFRQAGKDTGVAGQQFAPANAQSGDFTVGQSAKKGDLRRIMAEQKRAEAAARTAATTAKGAANVAAQTQAGSARLADRLTRDLSGHAVKVDELLRAIQSPDELRKAAGVQVGEMSQRATDLTAAQAQLKQHDAIEKAYGFEDPSAQEAALELVNRRIAEPAYEVKLHRKAVEDSTDSPYRETGYNKKIPSGHGGSPFTVGDIDDLRKELKAFDGVSISHVELLAKLHDIYTARQAHLDDARRIIDATRGKYGASRTGFKEPSYEGGAVNAGDLTTGAARLTRLERGKAVAERRAAREALGKMPSVPKGIQRQAQRLSDKTPEAMANTIGRADRAVARGRTDAAKVAGRTAKLEMSATERAAYAKQHTELNARRNAAIAKLTDRQTEILDRDNAIVVPKFLTAPGALFGADARKGKFPTALRDLSESMKSVLFLNPMPHVKNIGVLQIEGPNGERNLARGTAIFLQGVTRPQFADAIAELDRIGGRSSFFQDRESLIDRIPGVKQISKFSHDKLWEYDTAQRLSLNEYLKRTAPESSDYERGARINEVLFDYAHRSPLAEMLADIGAPFPHWRLSNPGRQLRRAVENPAGVERLARAETDYNQDVTGKDAGYKMNFATPLDEGAKAVVDPLRYFGATTGGPIRTALPYLSGEKNVEDLAGELTSGSAEMDAARAFIPEVGMAESITGIGAKFPTKAPQIAAAAGGIVGAYPQNDEGRRALAISKLMRDNGWDKYTAGKYYDHHSHY